MWDKIKGAAPWVLALAFAGMWLRGCDRPEPVPPKPPVSLPARLEVQAGVAKMLTADTKAEQVDWEYLGDGTGPQLLTTGDPRSRWVVAPPGDRAYRVRAQAIIAGKIEKAECLVVVGTPPVPPDPGPDPPTPDPDFPVKVDDLHVMVVYDALNVDPSLRNNLMAKDVVSYLDSKGGHWRVWDKSVDAKNEAEMWQKLFARAKEKMNVTPWAVVVSKGKLAPFEGALPKTKDEILTLFKKYGG